MKLFQLVTTYNLEKKQIDKLIDSIEQQTNKNSTFIIHDDFSNKNYDYLKTRIKNVKNIILIRSDKNVGVCESRNRLIDYFKKHYYKKEKEQYISFVDGDDWLSSNYVQSFYDKVTNEDVIFLRYKVWTKYKLNIRGKYGYYKSSAACEKFIKASLIIENNLKFKNLGNISEDLYFSLSVYNYTNKYSLIKYKIYNYEFNENSSTHKTNNENSAMMTLRYINEWIKGYKPPKELISFVNNWFMHPYIFKDRTLIKLIDKVSFPHLKYLFNHGFRYYIIISLLYLLQLKNRNKSE